jgi:addiction module HigA family antidote
MDTQLDTPLIGDIFREEFMEPFGLSAYALAKAIHVPSSRILEIIHNQRRISVETALKLARFFGTSERYFINLQTDIDIRNQRKASQAELERIHPLAV